MSSKALSILGVGMILGLIVLGVSLYSGPDDGIEYDKVYTLAFSGPVELEMGERVIVGRQFDFADRNLPTTSIVVPEQDHRGVPVVVHDPKLPLTKMKNGKLQGVVKKVMVRVPAVKIEGERYPAYEYPQWRYNLAIAEPIRHTPRVIPRR